MTVEVMPIQFWMLGEDRRMMKMKEAIDTLILMTGKMAKTHMKIQSPELRVAATIKKM